MLEFIESMVYALDRKGGLLGVMNHGQSNIDRTKIKQGKNTPAQDVIVCHDKTVMVKRI